MTAHPGSQAAYQLLRHTARQTLASTPYTGPLWLLDPALVGQQYLALQQALPRARIHYAVKANPHPAILHTLLALGSDFEIASEQELDSLLQLGVEATRILYSNPIKARRAIRYAYQHGVRWFASDSVEETLKIAAEAPDATQYLRLEVDNNSSDYPLGTKFGLAIAEVPVLLAQARLHGVDIGGVHFHVGSQCRDPAAWLRAIDTVWPVMTLLREQGFRPRLLNLGGGFPISYDKQAPDIASIGAALMPRLMQLPADCAVVVEPGRYMSGPAGLFICEVINVQHKHGKRWVYADAGMFSGLYELMDGFHYPLELNGGAAGPSGQATLAGPTCDSCDVLSEVMPLPDTLQEGDLLWFYHSGVYTQNLVTTFNGMPAPRVVVCLPGGATAAS